MSKIKVFETFSGIGAQHKSLDWVNKNLQFKNKFEVVATADWDIRAIIAYAAIHNKLKIDEIEKILLKNNIKNEEELNSYLNKHVFSRDSKNPIKSIINQKEDLKKILASANFINKNYSDIKTVTGEVLDNLKIDLLTYSFPCQGLSVASMGRDKGIKNKESTSHLIWEIGRILEESNHKPKYLLLENVRGLVTKYSHEYEEWKHFLSNLGYKTFTGILNASNHGSLQNRERVFAISVLKDYKTPFNNDEEYLLYLNKIGQKYVLNDIEERKKKYFSIFDLNNKNIKEAWSALINDTPSRKKVIDSCKNLSLADPSYKINTLTTKQDRIPNAGYIPISHNFEKKLQYRFITPREAYKIMGFEDLDFNKLVPFVEEGILNNDCLWRQAGNSIDVNVLKRIFEVIGIIDEMNKNKR